MLAADAEAGQLELASRSEQCGYDSAVNLVEAGTVESEPQRHVEVFIEGNVKVCV